MSRPAWPEDHIPALFSHNFGALIKSVLRGYDRLLALAHPIYRQILEPLYGLSYYWTNTQSEYATDLVFKDPEQ